MLKRISKNLLREIDWSEKQKPLFSKVFSRMHGISNSLQAEKHRLAQLADNESERRISAFLIQAIDCGVAKLSLYIRGRQPSIEQLSAVRAFDPHFLRDNPFTFHEFTREVSSVFPQIKFFLSETNGGFERDLLLNQLGHYFDSIKSGNLRVDCEINPMSFWLERLSDWPRLARIVLRVLTIPISAADVERSFSIHRYILTDRRRKFKSINLEAYQVIYVNRGAWNTDLDF